MAETTTRTRVAATKKAVAPATSSTAVEANGTTSRRPTAGTCSTCGQKVHKGRPRPGNELWDVVLVTPAMATEWLTRNHRNRPLVASRVTQYVEILRRGEWLLTNDSLCFDENNGLLNGQHRLAAVVEADTPARFGVIWGLDVEAQDVMDGGLPRRLADALHLRGFNSWHHLAASLKFLHRYEFIASTGGGQVNYSGPGEQPVTRQCLNLLDKNPQIVDFVPKVRALCKALHVRSGMTTTLYYLMAQACTRKGAKMLDTSEPDAFFHQLLTLELPYGHEGKPVAVPANSPVRQLERWLQHQRDEKPRAVHTTEAAMICKAWNMWIRGETVQTLTWHGQGGRRAGKEKFPIILGPSI